MADLRTLLAAVLGLLLGAVCLLAPGAVVRAHTVGRRPDGGRGEYGADSPLPDRWRHLVRAAGVGLVLAGGYFGYVALA
ncbi:hypothetical protein [Haloplanus halophilus]|uniref:hypothetical protein n=1 Tax=Haloplanus halophilus TaxID=2949993 RepID=UPI00203A9D26|nr:hypothetical protein [Haloplanus sp. GDY1]